MLTTEKADGVKSKCVSYMTKAGKMGEVQSIERWWGGYRVEHERMAVPAATVGRSNVFGKRETNSQSQGRISHPAIPAKWQATPAGSGKDRKRLRADFRDSISDDVFARRQESMLSDEIDLGRSILESALIGGRNMNPLQGGSRKWHQLDHCNCHGDGPFLDSDMCVQFMRKLQNLAVGSADDYPPR